MGPANVFSYTELSSYLSSKLHKLNKRTTSILKRPLFKAHKYKNHLYKALYLPTSKGSAVLRRLNSTVTFRRYFCKKYFSNLNMRTRSQNTNYSILRQDVARVRLHNPLNTFTLSHSAAAVLNKKNSYLTESSFIFKKSAFSFLKKHQLKRDIIMRKQRVNLHRYTSSLSSTSLTNSLLTSLLFLKSNGSTSMPNESRDLSMQRVKFKPGYRRLWKESRLVLSDLLGKKYEFQHQFTKYLVKFYRKANFYNFSHNELKLTNVILYSKLLPDVKSIQILYNNKMIFLNGLSVSSLSSLTKSGDVVQLLVSSWFYTYSKWLLMWSSSRSRKLRRLIYRKVNLASMQNYRAKKQRSYHTPGWVHNAEHDTSDIKHYLEVDFFTLSSVVIFDNMLSDHYSNSTPTMNKQYIYKIYNWKYIN